MMAVFLLSKHIYTTVVSDIVPLNMRIPNEEIVLCRHWDLPSSIYIIVMIITIAIINSDN